MRDEQDLWLAARARMLPYVHAVYWQHFGIEGDECNQAVDGILDGIFRPEFFGATDRPVWRVMRQDDNGNHFEIARNLSHGDAQTRLEAFEASGHKQYYWILPKPDVPIA